jgi:hypothetical protein
MVVIGRRFLATPTESGFPGAAVLSPGPILRSYEATAIPNPTKPRRERRCFKIGRIYDGKAPREPQASAPLYPLSGLRLLDAVSGAPGFFSPAMRT